MALGIDAFALNIGDATADWAISTVRQLFDHADNTDFKLFVSMDFYQSGDPNVYTELLNEYTTRPSYLTAGPNNYPVVSTFSVASFDPSTFQTWKQDVFNGEVYFLPNADTSAGYEDPATWFQTWGDVVDGVFGWESAWPAPGDTPANVSDTVDTAVQNAAHDNSKTYMARK